MVIPILNKPINFRLLALNQGHKLGAGGRLLAEGAPQGRGDDRGPRFLDTAHHHTQVLRLDDHGHAAWLQAFHYGLGNLGG